MTTEKSKWASPPRIVNVIARGSEIFLVPTRASVAASERYTSFLRKAITAIGQLDCKLTALVHALIIFETPVAVEDIGHMLEATLKVDASTSPVNISWYCNRRLCCRELSRHTCQLINQVDRSSVIPIPTILSRAVKQINDWYPLPNQAKPHQLFDWVINDALAWNFSRLPKPLLADLIGKQPIEPLPPSVLQRQFSITNIDAAIQTRVMRKNSPHLEALTEAITSALLANENRPSSAWMINELLAALSSKGSSSSEPRKSHGRERDTAMRSISTLTRKLERCDSAAAMMFDWALFMLAEGTARTKAGNVQTIRIYLRDLAQDLYQEIRIKKFNPLDLSDDDWRKLLTTLLERPANGSRGSAVAAFSKYLQLQIGVEPALPRIIPKEVRPVSANVIWAHEFESALTLIQSGETDERLQQQIPVMLLIGNAVPIRIGELALLQLRSIRRTKVGENSIFEIEIAPSRGLHPGKSNAARRIMFVGTTEDNQALMHWKTRREVEGAQPDDFLFGNPHVPLKLYQIGRSIQSLHRTLKLATGDSSVSFHTLRHTVITRFISEAFQLNDPIQANVRLKEIADMAGHSQPATTLRHYFHLPFVALRSCVDKHLMTFISSKPARKAWGKIVKLPPRQMPKIDTGRNSIFPMPEVGVSPREGPASSLEISEISQEIPSIETVRKILLDVSSGLSPQTISQRCSVSPLILTRVVDTALQVTGNLLPSRMHGSLSIVLDSIDSRFDRLRGEIGQVGLVFEEPKLSPHRAIWKHIANASPEERVTATKCWLACFNNGFLNLRSRGDYEPLLRFLHCAKIPQAHFVIRLARSASSQYPNASDTFGKSIQAIRAILGADIAYEFITSRRGRPQCYLLVARRPVFQGFSVPSAACRMAEVHAAFVLSAVFTLLLNSKVVLA